MALRNDITLKQLVDVIPKLETPITYLGICPMSEEIIRASIGLAKEHSFPVMFVASRNQISEKEGGGYVMGLTPQTFVQLVEKVERELGLHEDNSPPYIRHIGVDHCGPWYRTNEKELGMEDALRSVEKSITACVEAEYSVIHIDPSFTPPLTVKMDKAGMIDLGVRLVQFAEQERRRLGKTVIKYEIGTEETTGPGTDPNEFRKSIEDYIAKSDSEKLPRPTFIVGKTGTRIEGIQNKEIWNCEAAHTLPDIAREFGMGFKEHNADYLPDGILEFHPTFGITAANVGPCFATTQTKELLKLAEMENGSNRSNLYKIMSEAVLEDGHYLKWLPEGVKWTPEELRKMPHELMFVTELAGHYVYYKPEVNNAIKTMYSNLKKERIENPEAIVMHAVKNEIMRYVCAFNLRGSTERILQHH